MAQLRNQPASQVILELVKSALAESHPPSQKRLTTAELRQLSAEAQTQLLQRQAQAISEYQEIDAYKSPAGGKFGWSVLIPKSVKKFKKHARLWF